MASLQMNLAVRGIDADIRWNNEGSFHKDELKDKRSARGAPGNRCADRFQIEVHPLQRTGIAHGEPGNEHMCKPHRRGLQYWIGASASQRCLGITASAPVVGQPEFHSQRDSTVSQLLLGRAAEQNSIGAAMGRR